MITPIFLPGKRWKQNKYQLCGAKIILFSKSFFLMLSVSLPVSGTTYLVNIRFNLWCFFYKRAIKTCSCIFSIIQLACVVFCLPWTHFTSLNLNSLYDILLYTLIFITNYYCINNIIRSYILSRGRRSVYSFPTWPGRHVAFVRKRLGRETGC